MDGFGGKNPIFGGPPMYFKNQSNFSMADFEPRGKKSHLGNKGSDPWPWRPLATPKNATDPLVRLFHFFRLGLIVISDVDTKKLCIKNAVKLFLLGGAGGLAKKIFFAMTDPWDDCIFTLKDVGKYTKLVPWILLLMAEILHQLIGSLSHYL